MHNASIDGSKHVRAMSHAIRVDENPRMQRHLRDEGNRGVVTGANRLIDKVGSTYLPIVD